MTKQVDRLLQSVRSFGAVEAAVGRERARIEKEGVHLEGSAGVKRVRRKKGDDALARGTAQFRQRDVRREFALFGRKTGALYGAFDFALEMRDRHLVAHTRPQRARILAAELTHPFQLEHEARRA